MVIELVVLVVLLAVVGGLAATVVRQRFASSGDASWLDRVMGERVLVHTTDNQTIDGSLMAVQLDGLILRAATLHTDQPIPLSGELFVPRAKVSLVQRVGAGGDG